MSDKSIDVCAVKASGERGIALVTVLLITSLVLALIMGVSLTAISEGGAGNTYANQERAFQAAEAGLYHALSLVKNYNNASSGGDPNFTNLLAKRGATINTSYRFGNNPFTNSAAYPT